MNTHKSKALSLVFLTSLAAAAMNGQTSQDWGSKQIHHVLLISIDGLHAVDYLNCSKGVSGINNGEPYCPNIAALGQSGLNYLAGSTSKPSDSFPGLMAIVTGGTPRTVGAYYDVAYDRVYAPPAKTTGNGVAAGSCVVGKPNGTRTEYEEGIDLDQSKVNGGAPGAGLVDGGVSAIDPSRLIRDPMHNCAPVYPWNFIRTNTIFGVIHAAGGYTAWSDKHPAYSAVSGPGNGANVDDFFSPEINSLVVPLPGVTTVQGESCAAIQDNSNTSSWTNSFLNIKCYDAIKVNSVLNWIKGRTHDGGKAAPVPVVFGMNFQAVSVGQKLIEPAFGAGGYLNGAGAPANELIHEITFVDDSIGAMVTELKSQGLYDSTLIVITAKHGQTPVDVHRFFPIPGPGGNNGESPATLLENYLPYSESPANPNGIGPTEDDISLLWLKDSRQTTNAVNVLEQNAAKAGIGQIFYGASLNQMFNAPGLPPTGDPRTPDIIVAPNNGVVYTGSSSKHSEHGGFNHDDTNVIMLLSNPKIQAQTFSTPVETTQVAPTILEVLGLQPSALDAVRIEGTEVLPGTNFSWNK